MNTFSRFKTTLVAFIILTVLTHRASAQYADSLNIRHQKPPVNWQKAVAVPTILIATGIWATTDNDIIDKYEIKEERNELAPMFRTHIDDYLQYAPIAAVYGLNALGIKGEHDFANRTALLLKSELFMMAMVLPLKHFTDVPRPDTGAPNSFPSGHTAQAFAAATFLHKEYGKDHPMYSVLAYTTATGIGVLRVMNNRHWASDVLVGAGIGILATNLAYLTHQNKWGNNKNKKVGVVVMPMYNRGSIGAGMGLLLR
jgi:hypothetical protein